MTIKKVFIVELLRVKPKIKGHHKVIPVKIPKTAPKLST
jgi:hypothetical protein